MVARLRFISQMFVWGNFRTKSFISSTFVCFCYISNLNFINCSTKALVVRWLDGDVLRKVHDWNVFRQIALDESLVVTRGKNCWQHLLADGKVRHRSLLKFTIIPSSTQSFNPLTVYGQSWIKLGSFALNCFIIQYTKVFCFSVAFIIAQKSIGGMLTTSR